MNDFPAARLALAKKLWNWTPHPTQRRWLLDGHKTKTAACGRRWGKTEAAAIDAASFALFHPGSAQMIVSPTYDQSRLIFDTVEKLLLANRITERMVKIVRTPYPRAKVGRSVITARTADEDGRNLRGHSADRVIVDEAAFVRDAVVEEVISPMLADRDGQLILISTPCGKNHFFRAFMKGFSLKEQAADVCLIPCQEGSSSTCPRLQTAALSCPRRPLPARRPIRSRPCRACRPIGRHPKRERGVTTGA